jgi:16S rRNA processing protein RimM
VAAAERVCVAQIGAAHGVRGEVKLKSFTAEPMAVKDYGPLETEDGTAQIEIEALRPAKDHFVAWLRGVRGREAAEALRNVRLFVPRARLPKIEREDEFYHADLIGLAAVDRAGAEVGTIVAIHNFGAGDLLEIRPAEGGDTVMLPFTDATAPVVDIAGARVVIDPPHGLFKSRA